MSNDEKNYDLIVIGAGMAGNAAANKCASAGWRVAIVDELPYGGTCALRGCDPKKILRRGAEIIDSARLMSGKGIDADGLHINWADLMQHKLGFTEPVPANMERGLTGNGVETLHGTATFTGTNSLKIDDVSYTADHFLIATGARPQPLDFPGAEHLVDSTAFLDLVELPKRILFVGGGFISFEFAHIAARAGSRPTIVDRGPRPLKGFDPDLVDLLIDRSTHAGIETHIETSIVSVEADGSRYRVTVERDGNRTTLDADLVVHGAGRISELSRLGLEAAGVHYGPRGVNVAGHLQSTTNPRVFAAGDSADTPGMALTPIAVFEGKIAASNMLKSERTFPTTPASRPRCSRSPNSPALACSKPKPSRPVSTSTSVTPTRAAGTPTTASGKPPQQSRFSSTPPATRSSGPTCSAPSTANSSTSAHSPSNSG